MINRRSFMAGILAAGAAPAVARSGMLMPVRELWTPPLYLGSLSADIIKQGTITPSKIWVKQTPYVAGDFIMGPDGKIWRCVAANGRAIPIEVSAP